MCHFSLAKLVSDIPFDQNIKCFSSVFNVIQLQRKNIKVASHHSGRGLKITELILYDLNTLKLDQANFLR